MGGRWFRHTAAAAIPLLVVVLAISSVPAGAGPAPGPTRGWVDTWATALTPSHEFFPPVDFDDQSIRMIVQTTSVGGDRIRIRLSNAYGTGDLTVGAASVVRPAAPSSPHLRSGTVRTLRFGGDRSVTVPPGTEVLSDPITLPVAPLSQLAVTVHLPAPTTELSFHLFARQQAYIYDGDRTGRLDGGGAAAVVPHFYLLAGVEVHQPVAGGAVAFFGASITDGFGATLDANSRVSDYLARRLVSETGPVGRPGVLNLSLSGNAVSHDHSAVGMPPVTGRNGVDRLAEHVLPRAEIRTVVVDLGLADIFQRDAPAAEIIDGLSRITGELRGRGIRVLLTTLTPVAVDESWTPAREAIRQEVNAYIRTTGDADGVVDADRAVRDPGDPNRLDPRYDSGDGVHPNDRGNLAIARAVPLSRL